MRRPCPATDAARRRAAGYTLIEVMVAVLISCVMVAGVMGVAISAKQSGGVNQRHVRFNQGIAQLSGQLKSYVTGCGCVPKTGVCPSPACYLANATPIEGPNTANSGVATWYLNGAVGATLVNGTATTINDSASAPSNGVAGTAESVWALMCGTHYITGVMNGGSINLEAQPYDGYISYTVTWPNSLCTSGGTPGTTDTPQVTFNAVWNDL